MNSAELHLYGGYAIAFILFALVGLNVGLETLYNIITYFFKKPKP